MGLGGCVREDAGALMRLGAGDVDSLVEPEELVEDVARILSSSEAVAPLRASMSYRGAWFAAMPAAGGGFFAVKLVGVYPGNPGRGLPLVRGLLLLFDAETGEPLLEADAGAATGWRTAAATALALRLMGGDRGVLGVVGAGVQAEYHLRVLSRVARFNGFLVYSRRPWRTAALARRYGADVVDSLPRLVRVSDTLVLATTSTRPLVDAPEALGKAVASVGAPRPVRELGRGLLVAARCVVADTVEGVASEAGEYEPGLFELVGLGDLAAGRRRCRWGGARLYKSVGTALLDLAIALHLYRRASRLAP